MATLTPIGREVVDMIVTWARSLEWRAWRARGCVDPIGCCTCAIHRGHLRPALPTSHGQTARPQ